MKFFVLCHDINLEVFYKTVISKLGHEYIIQNEKDFNYIVTDFNPDFVLIDDSFIDVLKGDDLEGELPQKYQDICYYLGNENMPSFVTNTIKKPLDSFYFIEDILKAKRAH